MAKIERPGTSDEATEAFTAPSGDYRQRATFGIALATGVQGSKLALQFLSVILLSRLLGPRDFGLYAMIVPLMSFVGILQDIGLAQATISEPTITNRQVSSLFWINIIVGSVLAVVIVLLSPLIGLLYHDTRVVPLAAAFAAPIFLGCVSAQHFALIIRRMEFTVIAKIDLAGNVIRLLMTLSIAWIWPSVWALYFGTLAGAASAACFAWVGGGWRPLLHLSLKEVRDMLRFGGGLTTFNITNFFSRNLDNILIGSVAGAVQLGLYDRAYKLLMFPLQQVNQPLQRVMQPLLARVAADEGRYRHIYLRAIRQIILISLPGIIALVVAADKIVPTLLGEQWIGVVPIFVWLGLAALHQPVSTTTGWLFTSQRRTAEYARWGAFSAITHILAFLIGLPWGAVGVAASYSLSDVLIRWPALWWYVGRSGPIRTSDLVRTTLPLALCCAAGAGAVFFVQSVWPGRGVLHLLSYAATSYGTAWALIALIPSGRATIHEVMKMGLSLRRLPNSHD